LTSNIERWVAKPIVAKSLLVLKFVYSEDGIDDLIRFCNGRLHTYGKRRNIFATGYAEIKLREDSRENLTDTLYEGQYIVKYDDTDSTDLYIMTKEELSQHYTKE
jgi:hypothetical protein